MKKSAGNLYQVDPFVTSLLVRANLVNKPNVIWIAQYTFIITSCYYKETGQRTSLRHTHSFSPGAIHMLKTFSCRRSKILYRAPYRKPIYNIFEKINDKATAAIKFP